MCFHGAGKVQSSLCELRPAGQSSLCELPTTLFELRRDKTPGKQGSVVRGRIGREARDQRSEVGGQRSADLTRMERSFLPEAMIV
jgi:hypothetical protein